MISFAGKGILLDVEGTTSSVRFVYDVLFPFARSRVEKFLAANWSNEDVQKACGQIAKDAGTTSFAEWTGAAEEEIARRQVAEEVYRLMDGDFKATGLKQLQGLIWREGFESGQLCSHVYEDVPPALSEWQEAGKELRIYSSGSITAQKLFFAHTEKGNLLSHFSGNYDTTTGPKKEAASYAAIAGDWGLAPGSILFISDVVGELDAAAAAGMKTALSIRPENAPVAGGHNHAAIRTFAEIELV